MRSFLGYSVGCGLLLACNDPAGVGGAQNEGGGGAGGGPACVTDSLPEDELVTVSDAGWPGPVVISHESDGGEVSLVSIDPDGTIRWMLDGFDYYDSGMDVWQAEAALVVVSGGPRELSWPDSLPGLTSVRLERFDARQIIAHVTADGEDSDQLWLAGALCMDRCEGGPAYPCELDFESLWAVAEEPDR